MTCCLLQTPRRSVSPKSRHERLVLKVKGSMTTWKDQVHGLRCWPWCPLDIQHIPWCCLLQWCQRQVHRILAVRAVDPQDQWHHWSTAGLPKLCLPWCISKTRPIDDRPVTKMEIDHTILYVEATFCYLGDMLCSDGAVRVPLLADVAWYAKNTRNTCLSKPSGISHLGWTTRYSWPASTQLFSTVAKRGDQMPLTSSSSATMTMTWSTGSVVPKTEMKHPQMRLILEVWCYIDISEYCPLFASSYSKSL